MVTIINNMVVMVHLLRFIKILAPIPQPQQLTIIQAEVPTLIVLVVAAHGIHRQPHLAQAVILIVVLVVHGVVIQVVRPILAAVALGVLTLVPVVPLIVAAHSRLIRVVEEAGSMMFEPKDRVVLKSDTRYRGVVVGLRYSDCFGIWCCEVLWDNATKVYEYYTSQIFSEEYLTGSR